MFWKASIIWPKKINYFFTLFPKYYADKKVDGLVQSATLEPFLKDEFISKIGCQRKKNTSPQGVEDYCLGRPFVK